MGVRIYQSSGKSDVLVALEDYEDGTVALVEVDEDGDPKSYIAIISTDQIEMCGAYRGGLSVEPFSEDDNTMYAKITYEGR